MPSLPFSKQLIAAAAIVLIAPSATVIAAKSFEGFLNKSNVFRVAQETTPQPADVRTDVPPAQPPQSTTTAPVFDFPKPPFPGSNDMRPPEPVPVMPVKPSEFEPNQFFPKIPSKDRGTESPREPFRSPDMKDRGFQGPTPGMGTEGDRGAFNREHPSGQSPMPPGSEDGQGAFRERNDQGPMMDGSNERDNGPSDEEMERREREQKARMLKEMQRNIRGMEQGVSMMVKGLRVCTSAKVEVPAAINAALEKMKATIALVKSATSADAIEDIDFSEFGDIGDSVRELIDGCHRIREFPRITKQISAEVRRLEAEFRSVNAQAKRSKIDVAEQLQSISQGITQIKATLASIGSVRSADAVEEAMEKLEDLRDTFDDIREEMGAVRAVVNMTRGIADARRELRDAERRIGFLARRKLDTSELKRLLAEGKTLLADIETLAKQKPIDADALLGAFEKLEDLGSRADDEFARVEGKPEPGSMNFSRSPASDLKLDVFDRFRGSGSEGSTP